MILVIDSDKLMAKCVAKACGKSARVFSDAISAMAALNEELPELIFLEIMLTGPDGWTFLNELISYEDTAKIPVVIMSALDFSKMDLSVYGVVGVLNKDTMTPNEVRGYVEKYTKAEKNTGVENERSA